MNIPHPNEHQPGGQANQKTTEETPPPQQQHLTVHTIDGQNLTAKPLEEFGKCN